MWTERDGAIIARNTLFRIPALINKKVSVLAARSVRRQSSAEIYEVSLHGENFVSRVIMVLSGYGPPGNY